MVSERKLKKPGVAKGRRYIGSEIVFTLVVFVCVILCLFPMLHILALSMSGRNAVLALSLIHI